MIHFHGGKLKSVIISLLALLLVVDAEALPWLGKKASKGSGGFRGRSSGGVVKQFVPTLEIDFGYSEINYSETNELTPENNTRFNQTGSRARGKLEMMPWPGVFYIGTSVDKFYPETATVRQQSDEDTSGICCEIETTDYRSYIGYWVPGTRPLNVTLLAEYYVSRMKSSSPSFGYSKITGMQYGFAIETTNDMGAHLYLKYYPFNDNDDRTELNVGLHLNIGGKPQPYPYSIFKTGFMIKANYKKVTNEIELSNSTTEIAREEMTFSIGFRF